MPIRLGRVAIYTVASAQRSLRRDFAIGNFSFSSPNPNGVLVHMTQLDLTLAPNPVAATILSSITRASDEKSQALETLIQRSGHRGLNQVRVFACDGWIVLRGCVASFYLKQLAQEAVRPMAIGMQIRNELQVAD